MTQTVEKIQTGLTKNYVSDWTVEQGLKEAMQNIAYGVIKSGVESTRYHDPHENMWAIEDAYKGLEKSHLYIGESDQRGDEDGLGNFGEGWKLFLLIMARNQIPHRVDTVGFSFWGTMEPTSHGPEVLVINVEDNDREMGTVVKAGVEGERLIQASESFGILQGIDKEYLTTNCILPDRHHELWVQGVRIEQGEETNPLNLYYSYNLNQRSLMNRDRSHVNTSFAYHALKPLIYNLPMEEIEEYVGLAIDGSTYEDIVQGPYVPLTYSDYDEKKSEWLQVLGEAHECDPSILLIPSHNKEVNREAEKKGFVLLATPRQWESEIQFLGIKKADDLIDDRYDITETTYISTEEDKTVFTKAKTKMKKICGLASVKELPNFQYVEDIISTQTSEVKKAHYDASTSVIYLSYSLLEDEFELILHVLPELMMWRYGSDGSVDLEHGYKRSIMAMLGLTQ